MYSSDDDNIETVDIDQDLDLLAAEVEEKNYVPPRPRTPSPLRVRTPSPPPLAQPYFQSALNPHIWGDVRRDFTSYAIPHTRSYSMPSILFQSPPPSQSFIAPTNIDDEMVFDSIVDAAHDDDIKEFKYAVENTSFMEDDLFIAILSTLLEDLNSDSKYILLFLGAFSDYVITTINTTFTCIVKSQRIDLLDYFISAFSQHKPKDWFWYNINRKWYLNSASEEFKNHLNNYFPFEQYFISGKEKIHPPSSSTLYAYGDCSNEIDTATQDKFSSNSDIVYIQFDDIVKCYDRQVLIDWFTNQEPFCIWLGSTDPYRRKDFRLYKLYQREYITPYSVDLIARSTARAFEAVYFDTVLIGNAVGDLGVSTVHGTESARVYYLKYI